MLGTKERLLTSRIGSRPRTVYRRHRCSSAHPIPQETRSLHHGAGSTSSGEVLRLYGGTCGLSVRAVGGRPFETLRRGRPRRGVARTDERNGLAVGREPAQSGRLRLSAPDLRTYNHGILDWRRRRTPWLKATHPGRRFPLMTPRLAPRAKAPVPRLRTLHAERRSLPVSS